jgi:hypothetical protein
MLETLRELSGPAGSRCAPRCCSCSLGSASLDDLRAGLAEHKPPETLPGWFEVVGVKLFADGIPPNQTAGCTSVTRVVVSAG